MIVSHKQRRPSRLARLLSWIAPGNAKQELPIFSESQFRLEMQKEKSRIDRRKVNSEFAVVLIDGLSLEALEDSEILGQFQQRLRLTDCFGHCDNRLGVLLPETTRSGARIVADDLEAIAANYDFKTVSEILMYPDDDEIARNSIEFQDFQFSAESKEQDPSVEKNGQSDAIRFAAPGESARENFFQQTPPMPVWKRAMDVFGSLAGLVFLSPVFVVAAMAVKYSGPGPVFFRQRREGKDGRVFQMLKFRTMCDDAEMMKGKLREFSEQDGPAFKIENDPRLTRVGKYLRKSCIDELPQLINVLTGDMSLVGPRPLPVSESIECLIWQRKRLEVTPGLTCIWQIRGNRKTKFVDWMRMDMEYIRHRSLWLDVKLIFQTIWVAVLHRGSV